MNDFVKLLAKPIKERRQLSAADIKTLVLVDLDKEYWAPSKALKALELMQIALRSRNPKREVEDEQILTMFD